MDIEKIFNYGFVITLAYLVLLLCVGLTLEMVQRFNAFVC